MKRAIWLSFDLGVRGDYEGIYTWLDEHDATECGDNVAFLDYEFKGELLEALKRDLKESVDVTRKTRIYVIHRDPKKKTMKGRFIFGSRKAPPWSGYGRGEEEVEADES